MRAPIESPCTYMTGVLFSVVILNNETENIKLTEEYLTVK